MKKVTAVILNYKVKDDALECIKTIQASSYPTKIIVLDNNSDDGLEKEIKKIKGVEFIQNGDNLGYTGGNNVGIKKALPDSDYIFVVNPDVTVEKSAIENLVKAAEDNQVGIVGPKIYFPNSKTIWYAGGVLDLANVLGCHRGMDELDKGQFNNTEETDYVTGAAILIKKEVFKKIGFFDERYFLYYEDSDFCYRTKQAGFKILYVPEAIAYHKNARSTGLGSPIQDYYITRNRFLFASKFLSFRARFALFREGLKNLKYPVRRKAFFDFLLGKFGRQSIG